MFLPKFASLLLLTASVGFAAVNAPDYAANPAFQKARSEALALEAQPSNRIFAKGAWRKANSIAGGHCMECFSGMIRSTDEPKDAYKSAVEMEAAAETPRDKSTAEFYQGQCLLRQAGTDKPKPALVEAAHAALTKAIASDPTNYRATFTDGKALAFLNRNTEAAAAFQEFVKLAPKNLHYLLVRSILQSTLNWCV